MADKNLKDKHWEVWGIAGMSADKIRLADASYEAGKIEGMVLLFKEIFGSTDGRRAMMVINALSADIKVKNDLIKAFKDGGIEING